MGKKGGDLQSLYKPRYSPFLEDALAGMAMGTALKKSPGLGQLLKNERGQQFYTDLLGHAPGQGGGYTGQNMGSSVGTVNNPTGSLASLSPVLNAYWPNGIKNNGPGRSGR